MDVPLKSHFVSCYKFHFGSRFCITILSSVTSTNSLHVTTTDHNDSDQRLTSPCNHLIECTHGIYNK